MDESTGMFLEKVTPKAQESAAGKDSMSSEELYRNAYMDLTRGNYDLAQNGFMTFLLKFPESDLADNALYWLGECYYAQRDYAKALEQFIKLAKDYPKGDKVPSSMLKSGLAYQEMGKPNEALQMFQSLKKKYPDTREAQLAEEKVKKLKKRR
jgi:tol-pal system protein YbgF